MARPRKTNTEAHPIALVPLKAVDQGSAPVGASRYAKGGDMDHEPDDDLPMADLAVMDGEQLSQYGMRNLGIDFTGKSAQEMRDALTVQIGFRRAGGR